MRNRFMLAPLTNQQSADDGAVSDFEIEWLAKCAAAGFGMVHTCAAHVQPNGQAFPGQMAIFGDEHLPGLTRLADVIRAGGAVSSVQLHHGGYRALGHAAGTAVGPSDGPYHQIRGLSFDEVRILRDDFIAGAWRADRAGFDGVQLHAAFGWILMQFLSPTINRRKDCYGGDLEGRSRLIFEIIDGIRAQCGREFQISLRLSMERYGVRLSEIREVAARALREGKIDYLDLAPWDIDKKTDDEGFSGQSLLSIFTGLPRGNVRVGASGKITSARKAVSALEAGCDFVQLGRAAILHHDVVERIRVDPGYISPALPISQEHLRNEGLGPQFISYLRHWDGFVA